MKKRSLCLLLSMMLLGCARQGVMAPAGHNVAVAPDVSVTLPSDIGLTRSVDVSQLVVGTYGDQTFTFETRINADAKHFTMAGLDLMGRRSISVTWTKDGIAYETASWIPPQLKPEYVLADMILIYWPQEKARQALQGSATLLSKPHHRSIMQDGHEIISIDYQTAADKNPWHSHIQYQNNARGYTLDIQSAQATP